MAWLDVFMALYELQNRFNVLILFLIHVKLIKSRFQHIKHQKLKISWFFDFLCPWTPYLFILLHQITSTESKKIWDDPGQIYIILSYLWIWNFENLRNLGNLRCPFSNFELPTFVFWFYTMIKSWNHEESKTTNRKTLSLP